MRKICTRTCEVNLHFIRYIFTFSCHCNNTNVRGRRLNGKQRREIDRSEICMYRTPLYFFDISHLTFRTLKIHVHTWAIYFRTVRVKWHFGAQRRDISNTLIPTKARKLFKTHMPILLSKKNIFTTPLDLLLSIVSSLASKTSHEAYKLHVHHASSFIYPRKLYTYHGWNY